MALLGTDIRTTRERMKLSLREFAKKVGVDAGNLSKIEKGERQLSEKMQQRILDALADCDKEEDLECIYDYIRVRFPTDDYEKVIREILHLKIEYMSEKPSKQYGYAGMFQLDNIKCLFSEEGDERGTLIELSGKGCRQFEVFLRTRKKTWFDFFEDCERLHGNYTRIDLAINDYKKYLSIPALLNKTFAGECISKFKTFDFNGSGSLTDGSKQGVSIYFGSKSSAFYLCFYQKDYEQAKKLGIPVEEVEIKNRYELRLKDERAQEAIVNILTSGSISHVVKAVLNNYIRFADRSEKERRYWETNKKWENFIGETNRLKLTTKPTNDFYEKTKAWIKRSVSPALRVMQEVDRKTGKDELQEIIDSVELSEENVHRIKVLTSSVEEMVV